MGSRLIRVSALLLCAWGLGAWIAGCSKKTTAPKPTPEKVNEYKPNANARIVSQTIFGDVDKKTELLSMQRADNASFAFEGLYNSTEGVGALNVGGSLRWFHATTTGSAADIRALPVTSIVPSGAVAVGGHDTDGDHTLDVGDAWLYSSAGGLLSQVQVTSDSSDLWLTRVAPVDDSTYIACGGEIRSGVVHPLLTLLHLRAPGVLERGRTLALQSITGFFNDIVALPSSPGELSLAATSASGASSSIHGLRAPWPGVDFVTVDWSREIVPPTGPWVSLDDLEQAGGNLYVAGIVQDHRKQPPPSNGGSWESGLAASYTRSGDLRWATTDSLTRNDDGIFSIAIGPDALYAVGFAANYFSGANPSETFSYGLISKIDLTTGQVIVNFTLGQDHYDAGFSTAVWTASGLICGGWTEEELLDGPYRGWLSTVDVSGTMPVRATVGQWAPDPEAASGPRRGQREIH